ncbi:MAG: cell wall-binding repeat-containing protein, partial [Desulfosporosinus sp.]|nr:cell wall-binding repeat-containing protein [Desulfosporosinus sp.]
MCSLVILLTTATKVYATPSSQRIAGYDRYETAIQISQAGWKDGSKFVVLATGVDYPDALCAVPLAKKY